nr:hypothetical protein [Tanacetum cinerariifolium]
MVKRMGSMNTRLNIEKLDGNIVQRHVSSKQVGLKQLGSKQVGFKQLGVKQVGFKQLGPGVETGVHGVQDEKRVWFEVELLEAQGDHEAGVFQEKVHHGADVGAVIMKTEIPGQEGAKGNAAERYIEDSGEAVFAVAAVEEIYAHESLTFNDTVACELVKAKGNVLGLEIIKDQGGNTLRVSQSSQDLQRTIRINFVE